MGSVPVFARELTDAGLSAVSVSFYRNLLGAVVLVGLIRFDASRRKATLWALAAGVGMGLGWASYVRAVEVVPISTAGVIYMSYPLFAIVIAWLLFRNKPATRASISGLVVLAASVVALGAELSGADSEVLFVAFAAARRNSARGRNDSRRSDHMALGDRHWFTDRHRAAVDVLECRSPRRSGASSGCGFDRAAHHVSRWFRVVRRIAFDPTGRGRSDGVVRGSSGAVTAVARPHHDPSTQPLDPRPVLPVTQPSRPSQRQ